MNHVVALGIVAEDLFALVLLLVDVCLRLGFVVFFLLRNLRCRFNGGYSDRTVISVRIIHSKETRIKSALPQKQDACGQSPAGIPDRY